ncbi:hypothetical protein [Bdellovibrio bacteriovorus]|uniref:hypothetical protein n=1 Tax=Bdellovibrio bacteriovorus TaxID=959 RepID=UPI0035A5EF3D
MKKILMVLIVFTSSYVFAGESEETCKLRLENAALADFDNSGFRQSELPVTARALEEDNEGKKFRTVLIFQDHIYVEVFQVNDRCEIFGSTPIQPWK